MKTIDIKGSDGKWYRIPERQKEDFESWIELCALMGRNFIRPIYATEILEEDFIN